MFTVERPLDDGGVDEEAAVVEGDRDGESAVVSQEVIPSAVRCNIVGYINLRIAQLIWSYGYLSIHNFPWTSNGF